MCSGKITHPNFQVLGRPPRAHRKVPHLFNPHYSFAKKNLLKKQKQNNSCPFCNNLLNSTCRTRGNYLPLYKRRQALSSLAVACVTARLPYTISILWGLAGHTKAPSHLAPTGFTHSRVVGPLLSHWIQSLDQALSSCFPSPLSLFKKNSFLLKKYFFQEIMNSNCHGSVRDPRL